MTFFWLSAVSWQDTNWTDLGQRKFISPRHEKCTPSFPSARCVCVHYENVTETHCSILYWNPCDHMRERVKLSNPLFVIAVVWPRVCDIVVSTLWFDMASHNIQPKVWCISVLITKSFFHLLFQKKTQNARKRIFFIRSYKSLNICI